jgi:hypothetical protein
MKFRAQRFAIDLYAWYNINTVRKTENAQEKIMDMQTKEVVECLKKVLKEELIAIVREKEDGLLVRFPGGKEFIVKVQAV